MKRHFEKQADIALSHTQPTSARKEALHQLRGAPYAATEPIAKACLHPSQPPEIQLGAIAVLDKSEDERVSSALLAHWRQYSPEVRRRVLDAMFARPQRLTALSESIKAGEVSPTDITVAQQEQLLRHIGGPAANQLRSLLSAVAPQRDTHLAVYLSALAQTRHSSRGKTIYEKHCAQCHRIQATGHAVGPDLGTINSKPDEAVLADILYPNTRIDPEYRSYTIITRDGRSHAGILASESATNVVLIREKAETNAILRRDIEAMYASDVSLMPANLHEIITPQDAADLLAYLRAVLAKR